MKDSRRCPCGWLLHTDEGGSVSLDLDQVRDLLNAFGVDAANLMSVEVTAERIVVRRWRTDTKGQKPSIAETVVSHR